MVCEHTAHGNENADQKTSMKKKCSDVTPAMQINKQTDLQHPRVWRRRRADYYLHAR